MVQNQCSNCGDLVSLRRLYIRDPMDKYKNKPIGYYCTDCNYVKLDIGIEYKHGLVRNTKLYLFEVSEKGKCSHFQALFLSEELAEAAKEKYLKDPYCKAELMQTSITEIEVQFNLLILEWGGR